MDDATPKIKEKNPVDETVASVTGGDTAVPETLDEAVGPAVGLLKRMKALPEAVFTYLMSNVLAVLHKKIFDEHDVAEDDRDVIYYAELQTFVGEISLADFPDVVWNRLAWDGKQEAKAADVIIDILGHVFLPAQAHLGDVAGLITEFGGDLKKFPEKQIEIRRVTFKDGAAEIAAVVPDVEEDIRNRLRFIVESRLRDVRDDVDTKEMLMKQKKTGGMELSSEQADAILALMATKMRMTKYVEALEAEKPVGDAASSEQHQASAVDIKKIYAGTSEEQEAIGKRIERFAKVTEGDPKKMLDAYFQVLFPPDDRPTDPLYVVAGMLGMAEGDVISDAVESDDRYRAIVRGFLTDKGLQDELTAYEQEPTAPHFMNIFFQYVLRGIGEFDVANSARFGLRVINALKKQGYDRYVDLVAFDMEHGEFRWKDAIEP